MPLLLGPNYFLTYYYALFNGILANSTDIDMGSSQIFHDIILRLIFGSPLMSLSPDTNSSHGDTVICMLSSSSTPCLLSPFNEHSFFFIV